jgi:hypothetical protein
MLVAATLCGLGGVLASLSIRNSPLEGEDNACHDRYCALDAPPLRSPS